MATTSEGREIPSPPYLRGVFESVDHLRKVQRVTDAALANLPVDALLDELLVRVREALEADTAAILLLDKTKGELVARAAKGLEEEVKQGTRIPMGRGFAGRIAATGAPVILDRVTERNVVNPILLQKGIRSLLGVPLVVQGETLGVLHVGTLTYRRFTEEDSELLQVVGDRVGLAIHVGLYERQRAVARTLQRSLLPGRLPGLPGIAMAARYEPARGGEVGGDWYDAFALPGGALGVAIGDVVGRGLEAATVMGRLRNALRAYAIEMSPPGEVLQSLDRMFQHLHPEEMATALYGTLDPVDLTLRFACAGHLPPMVRSPDGSVRVLKVQANPPLGATFGTSFVEHTESLDPGSTIVLYTDGLVERRTGTLEEGLSRLSELCRADLPPQERCDLILEKLQGDEDDDVALLVVEIAQDLGDSWHLTLPADPKQLQILRRVLERWLGARSVSKERIGDVLAGTGEAMANAVQHAYGPSGGAVELEAEWLGDRIVIRIHDNGRWRPSRDPERGRGLPIMEALSDDVQVSRTEDGTSIELRWDVEG
jgi:anti-sigma regulatory factor (Ser/Thr protein kinase)/putative methionine-R-sulfoxide reductase with GAF domain